MTVRENRCVGCETCIGCGRDKDVEMVVCDQCGEYMLPIYKYDGRELCAKCIIDDLDLEEVE